MEIRTNTKENVSIMQLVGELDAGNAVLVDAELLYLIKRAPKQLWIDGKELHYISSAGLGVFLSHLPAIKSAQINLVFYNLNAKIRNVFNILGLDEMLQIVPDQESAMEYFGQPQNQDL